MALFFSSGNRLSQGKKMVSTSETATKEKRCLLVLFPDRSSPKVAPSPFMPRVVVL
eukprot:CAMPEP_0174949812 /NCGR_PEP_ID=MMETSP1355-20121228/92536_1 /TAXON_ID=464990 /ORGANISM="Hemiselmis tepida, Strain CCMP443" /LENGTH=55 /DNA_ID=CAMNT_0016197389 /DNA_START=83 /DNA_END=246 /DNA_ORIENTATION=+